MASAISSLLVMPVREHSRFRIWLERIFSWWRRGEESQPAPAQGLALAQADPDSDGMSNEFEYAMGSDPSRANALPGSSFGLENVEGENYFTFTFALPDPAPPGVIYEVQSSENLQNAIPLAARC